MPNPRLANFNRTNSTGYLPLWQMSVAYDQPLAILITAILVELNVVHYLVLNRALQKLARSFLEQLARKTTSLHLELAYQVRSLYSLALAHPFFLASSGEAALCFFFVTPEDAPFLSSSSTTFGYTS
jgi:hypothetical protein